MMMTKYYKAFNRDMTCRDFQYAEGGVYEMDGKPEICGRGFHFCKDLVLTLGYYPVNNDITENLYAEVEVLGDIDWEQPTKHKGCTNKLRIVRVIPDGEVKALVDPRNNSGEINSGDSNSGDSNSGYRNSGNWNSGDSNSGNWNSGNWNSGDSNSGNWNSGDSNSGDSNSGDRNSGNWNSGDSNSGDSNSGNWNSGDSNSGNWNSGDRNSGYSNSGNRNSGYSNSGNRNSGNWNSCNYETGSFNTEQAETIRIFNQPCLRKEWEDSYKPAFLFFDIDKALGYKGSFQKSWDEAELEDRIKVKELPNFDADVFFEISGIKVD